MRRIDIDGDLPDPPVDPDDPPDPGDPPDRPPPALHTWSRLEPLPQSPDLAPALQGAVADPLWLLARQWQFLEFAGEDAGTPIEVRVDGEAATLSRYLPGALGADAAARARDCEADGLPLEVAVEAEPARATHPRLVAESGLHLRRMLDAASLTALGNLFVAAYPLALDDAVDGDGGGDWLELARGRALDARALVAALVALRSADGTLGALPPRPAIPDASRAAARGVLERWLAWYEDEIVEPGPGDAAAWNPRRLEYAFATSARTSAGEVVLVAGEYADGMLDWQSVSAAAGSLGEPAAPQPPQVVTLRPTLPAPVGYAGKPAERFWEFEDAAVHFGAIDAGPTDLVRLLLVEFALVYGNDWFVVPARLPVGSLFRVTSFEVCDTFGVVTQVERSQDGDDTPWSLFEIGGVDGFFLAPTLADALGSEPVEQVALFRDEMANMAWGVERRVQGASGDGYDRADEASRLAAQQHVDGPPVDAQLVYRLATSVPEQWIPFVPVAAAASTAANPVIELQHRAIVRVENDGERRLIEPRGVLLGGAGDLRLAEEEVPREGAIVERSFQFARWFDGRALLWLGRRRHAGRGEGSSGLRFDTVELRSPPPPPPPAPTRPALAWEPVDQAAFTDQSKATPLEFSRLAPGQTGWLVVHVRNTGTATWRPTGPAPIRLGTWAPQDRPSRLAAPGWVGGGANRPAAVREASVARGQVGTFEFPIRAPAQAGPIDERFNLVSEAAAWFPDAGLRVQGAVVAPIKPQFAATMLDVTAFTTRSKTARLNLGQLRRRQTAWVVVRVRNTGRASWRPTRASPVRLGTWAPQDRRSRLAARGWVGEGANRPAAVREPSVAPGKVGTFEFPIRAPAQAGPIDERFNLIAGLAWFPNVGIRLRGRVR